MDNFMLDLSTKKIWITGASRGIGLAIARKLKETGASLILSSSNTRTMKNIMHEFAEYPKVFFLPFDLTSESEFNRIYEKINLTLENVDILINNAGIATFKPFTEFTLDEFDKMNAVNYRSIFLSSQAVLPEMINRKNGLIINILSAVVKKVFLNSSIYSATKSAVLAMDSVLREEVRDKGIKIVDVMPGATETDIWDKESRDKFSDKMMQPEDVAESIIKIIELSQNKRLMAEEFVLRPQWGDL